MLPFLINLNGELNDASKKVATINYSSVILYYPCSKAETCIGYSVSFDPGIYRIELWGAQGGHAPEISTNINPKGGYAAGDITFRSRTELFIHIGAAGTSTSYLSSYNGGGSGHNSGAGGGGTDLRTSNLPVDNEESIYSRIMIAGGGGGSDRSGTGGAGGGVNGKSGSTGVSKGGGQTKAGTGDEGSNLWKGGSCHDGEPGAAGGGGYYGGFLSKTNEQPGGGGSGYVSGHKECIGIKENGEQSDSSVHFSNVVFENPVLIDGDAATLYPIYSEYVADNKNGAARITMIMELKLKGLSCYCGSFLPQKSIFYVLFLLK